METTNKIEEEEDKNSVVESTGSENKDDSVKTPSPKKRKVESSHKYAMFPKGVVQIVAECNGISELPEDVLTNLAEEASSRLRELIFNCSVLLKNTNRKKLLTEDVNRELENADVMPLYGHSSKDDCSYTYIPEANVFIQDDSKVDIVAAAKAKTSFSVKKKMYITGCRVILDPRDYQAKLKKKSEETASTSTTTPGTSDAAAAAAAMSAAAMSKPSTSAQSMLPPKTMPVNPNLCTPGKPVEVLGVNRPPPDLLNYYLQVAKIILGGSTPFLDVALADVKTNPRVGPICPYFLNLIALSVNKMPRQAWLTNSLLSTVEAIVENQLVDPSCFLAVNRTVNSLLVIAIEPKVAKKCDDLLLRMKAAFLLAKVFQCWNIEKKQQSDIVRQLLQLLLDRNISLRTHFGAIVCLFSLGYRVFNLYFWPVIGRYIPILEDKRKTCSPIDVEQVRGSILMAAEKMYKKEWGPSMPLDEAKRRIKVDTMLMEYFGDTMVPRRVDNVKRERLYPKPMRSSLNIAKTATDDQTKMDIDVKTNNTSFTIQRGYLSHRVPYVFNSSRECRSDFFPNTTDQLIKSKTVRFNIESSNQRPLKTPMLGSNQLLYDKATHRFPTIWYNQKVYKNTRTIKFSKKSHKTSPAGDLFVLL